MAEPVDPATAATPMVMLSRLTGAWYAAGEGDDPDGWLTLAPANAWQRAWLCVEPTGDYTSPDGTIPRVSNLPGGPAHCFFTGEADHLPGCGEKILVDLP